MYLSASVTHFEKLLIAAKDLKADAIHFFAPNIVFILARNKSDYIFTKSPIAVGQSVLIPKRSLHNMQLYLKAARKGFSNPKSPFYAELITSVCLTSDSIRFNDSERLSMKVDIPAYLLKKDVEFKLEEVIHSSYDGIAPYLRLPYSEFLTLTHQMAKYKKQYEHKTQNSSDNAIRKEDGQLVWYYAHAPQLARIETDIRLFTENETYPNSLYPFSDRAIYLTRWLAEPTSTEEIIFLPRPQYSLIEAYQGDMTVKVRTLLKNDLTIQEV